MSRKRSQPDRQMSSSALQVPVNPDDRMRNVATAAASTQVPQGDAMQDRGDLTVRTFQIRAASVNEAERSVEAVIATDAPVEVYDYRSYSVIDEVLRIDGAEFADQVPLLESHNRWSLDSVLGSIRNIRKENGRIVGRLFFAQGDERAEMAWQKVRQGHITDVSAGYRAVSDGFVDIAPGQSATVSGQQYRNTSKNKTLRITSRWVMREGSLVPIGADQNSKIREAAASPTQTRTSISHPSPRLETSTMNPKLRKYLETIGLRADATDQDATAFLNAITDQSQRAFANGLLLEASAVSNTSANAAAAAPAAPAAATQPQQQRGQADAPAQQAPDQILAAERARVAEITRLAGDTVPSTLRAQAISEGWSAERAGLAFLEAERGQRAPAVHTTTTQERATREVLATALALRSGTNMLPARLTGEARTQQERVCNEAERFMDMSLLDMIRTVGTMTGLRMPMGRQAVIEMLLDNQRSGAMTAQLVYVFTTSYTARLMEGWEEYPDSTIGWVSEVDVPDFKSNERIGLDKDPGLKKLPRGGTAKSTTFGDVRETYKLSRFAKQAVIDEQDIIDDNLSIFQTIPFEMGEAARRLRPDLIYSLLLANAALSDTGALFNATAVTTAGGHANLLTGSGSALSATSLQNATVAMGKQTYNKVNLNISPAFLIVPQDLRFTAQILLQSIERIISADSGGTYNPLKELNMQVRVDNRIGVAGVFDPNAETARTGTATNWFLASRPGRTIECGYLSGTKRLPSVRSFVLDKGQWGIGWDIKHDIGAKALDYRGLYKSDGNG